MAVNLRVISDNDGVVHIAVEGEMRQADSSAEGTNPFSSLLGDQWLKKQVILDCSKCPYLDSATIGWLMGSSRKMQQAGGRLVLHSITPRMKPMLELLKVGKLVPIALDEPAARELIAKGAAQ